MTGQRDGGGLRLHVAERADGLLDALADLLADPLPDPFAAEVVATDGPGLQRWAAQGLARRLGAGPGGDGIAARIRFDPPWRLVADVLAAVLGVDRHDDPWHPDRLTWHVLATLDELPAAALGPVARYLGRDGADTTVLWRRDRRLRLARHLAELFVAYDARRPALLDDWHAGRDTDGTGRALPAELGWQPALWRAVGARIGVPAPSRRLGEATARLAADPELVDLPGRLSVFAPTTLPDAHLRVLRALATQRDVHVWLPHPSAALWQRVAAAPVALPVRRTDLPRLARHRLLASLAGSATELELALLPHAAEVAVHPSPARPGTLLGTVQQAIADDRGAGPRVRHATTDRTLQLHACHGRARQVEVLRDVLTGLLADDPTLQPRDVVVLCPDVAGFAPLLDAAFDPVPDERADGPVHPGRRLRVRVAARAPARA